MKKILLVDDEPLVIKALSKRLLSEGFDLYHAADGQEAMTKVDQIKPDLILLDIIMPKLDGISVLKKLKENSATQNIPVIILTNLYDDIQMEEILKNHKTDYLIKTEHSIADIVRRVKEKLS